MADAPESVQLATFEVDVTPEIGDPIAYGTCEAVDDPLSCRGVVVLTDDLPIVLASIDWIGTYNGAHTAWRTALADAAGTAPERVAMHAVHQHEAPGFNADAEQLKLAHGVTEYRVNPLFARRRIQDAAAALEDALQDPTPVSHVGLGVAEVEQVASNRQVLGPDGECCYVRYTSGGSDFEFASEAPEGVVDPQLYMLSFWDGDEAVAKLSYYATHPQSYYRNGRVTCDFPGIARNDHESETGVFQVHFAGAAGNVTAGKYNDGSEELRPVLAERVQDGMAAAWADTERTSVTSGDIDWAIERVELPPQTEESLEDMIAEFSEDPEEGSANGIAWRRRCELGDRIQLPRLRIGDTDVIHLPGEPFVEYQLAAQELRDDRTAIVAGYGDGGPGYIPTRAAYPLGGYEVGVAKVAPDVEDVLTEAMQRLVDAEDIPVTPSEITAEKPRADRTPES